MAKNRKKIKVVADSVLKFWEQCKNLYIRIKKYLKSESSPLYFDGLLNDEKNGKGNGLKLIFSNGETST